MSKTKFIKTKRNLKLAYTEFGDPKGKPLIYIHGYLGSGIVMKSVDTQAKKLGIKIIAIDRPGHGFSDYYKSDSLLDISNDINDLIQQLKIEKCQLLGSSAGGVYSLACVYKLNEYIEKVHLIAPLGPMCKNINNNWKVKLFLELPAKNKLLGHFLLGILRFLILHVSQKVMSITKLFFSKEEESKLDIVVPSVKRGLKQGIKATLNDSELLTKPWRIKFNEIKTKVHIWYGDNDSLLQKEHQKNLHKNLPNSKLFSDVNGHFLHLESLEKIINAK